MFWRTQWRLVSSKPKRLLIRIPVLHETRIVLSLRAITLPKEHNCRTLVRPKKASILHTMLIRPHSMSLRFLTVVGFLHNFKCDRMIRSERKEQNSVAESVLRVCQRRKCNWTSKCMHLRNKINNCFGCSLLNLCNLVNRFKARKFTIAL